MKFSKLTFRIRKTSVRRNGRKTTYTHTIMSYSPRIWSSKGIISANYILAIQQMIFLSLTSCTSFMGASCEMGFFSCSILLSLSDFIQNFSWTCGAGSCTASATSTETECAFQPTLALRMISLAFWLLECMTTQTITLTQLIACRFHQTLTTKKSHNSSIISSNTTAATTQRILQEMKKFI